MPSNTPPQADELEVSVFGPGFGECVVVHLGAGEWLIVDSCKTAAGIPVAMKYLQSIGIDMSTAVKVLVASHWHDDHVGGLADLFRITSAAKFVTSAALASEDFLTLVYANQAKTTKQTTKATGTSEWEAIVAELDKPFANTSRIQYVIGERLLYNRLQTAYARPCVIYTVSPNDVAYRAALTSIGQLVPRVGGPKKVAPPLNPNNNSIVLWIDAGGERILLGADLENSSTFGWSTIIASPVFGNQRAKVYKIPHHGSQNADHPLVWTTLLDPNPFVALTPFSRLGAPLPTPADIARIKARTNAAYVSVNPHALNRKPSFSPPVNKTIKAFNINVRAVPRNPGHIRLRQLPGACWNVDLLEGAVPL